jgi:HAD superfamily hydrolase (TIGR01549 family)
MIKAISFDLDDTLWPIMPTIMNAERETNGWIKDNYPGAATLLNSKDIFAIRDKLVSKNPNLVNQLSQLRRLAFIELGLLAGYSQKEAHLMAEKSFEIFFEARNEVDLYEGVEETLENLKKEYSLGVITNGNADLKKIGIDHYFDFSFSSSDLNASKPDPVMFEAVVKYTGLEAHEICHVGDHPINDVKASLEFGMKPIWFNENNAEWDLPNVQVLEVKSWSALEEAVKSF